MRDNIRHIIKMFSSYVDLPEPIVEFGSLQVSDQIGYADLRPFFPGKKYIGCDMQAGVGVDRLENLHKVTFPDNSVGTVITMDTLEHVENPFLALDEIFRILTPGGYLIMSSIMNFPIHNYPADYWRFTPTSFYVLMNKFPVRKVFSQGDRSFPHTVVGVAMKGKNENLLRLFTNSMQNIPGQPITFEPENVTGLPGYRTAAQPGGKYLEFKGKTYKFLPHNLFYKSKFF